MKRIAVVILNYNGAEMLRRFLPNVLENSPEANVYVADNGSTDNSVETMKREFPQVPLILFDKNHGFAEGYNLAIGKVEEEYALLLNSDVKVSPRWLQPLIDYMDVSPSYRRTSTLSTVASEATYSNVSKSFTLTSVVGRPYSSIPHTNTTYPVLGSKPVKVNSSKSPVIRCFFINSETDIW